MNLALFKQTVVFLMAVVISLLIGYESESSALGRRVVTAQEREILSLAARSMDQAMTALDKQIDEHPDQDELWRLKGDLFFKSGKLEDAMQAYERALQVNGKSKMALIGKGRVLTAKADYKTAEALLQEALSLNPNPAYAYYELGHLYELMGEYQKAIEHYRLGIDALGYKAGCVNR